VAAMKAESPKICDKGNGKQFKLRLSDTAHKIRTPGRSAPINLCKLLADLIELISPGRCYLKELILIKS